MKAILCSQYCQPDDLVLADIPNPVAGPGQAVIAINNARLFEEVQARTRDLTEALTYQTGSANILRVIASSPTDVKPVLQAIVESACELCGAYDALVRLKDAALILDLWFRLAVTGWPVVVSHT